MNMPTFLKGSSIHSSGQLEWFKTNVDKNLSKLVVPNLSILWMDTLSLFSSRMVWPMPPPLEDPQIRTWTHIHLSSSHLLINGTTVKSLTNPLVTPCLMLMVISISPLLPTSNTLLDAPPGDCGSYTEISPVFTANLHQSSPQEPDWNTQRPFLAWTSPSSIKDTFNVTTRHGTAPHTQDYIKKHFMSRNPVFSIPRCSEAVATDTIFSDTPAVDDGPTMVQFFCGHDTLVCDAYGIKSTKQFINTLSDNIRKRGAMDTLTSDGGKYEISKGVTDLLHSLFIQDYQSEPYHQDQNKTENCFGPAKHYTNTVMNTSSCPACCWLLCLQYICVVLHHLASPTLQGICPVPALQGTTPDISFMLHSSFYEPVYYRIDSTEPDFHFPSSSNGKNGHWVSFANNPGDRLTWRILTEDTKKDHHLFWRLKCPQNYNKPASCITFRGGNHTSFFHSLPSTI